MKACNKKVTLTSSQGKVIRHSNTRGVVVFLNGNLYFYIFKCEPVFLNGTCCIKMLPNYHSRSSSIRSKATSHPCSFSSLRVKMNYLTGRIHEVLPDAFASQPSDTRWLFLQDQQSNHSVLLSGKLHPRRSAIPQGCPVHPGQHGAALYPCQPSPNLSWDMPTSARSDGGQEALLVLDWQLSSRIYQSPEEVEVQQLREDHSGWTSDQEAIWLQDVPCKWRQQETALLASAASMEWSTGSFNAGENQDGHADHGGEIPSTHFIKWWGELKAHIIIIIIIVVIII